MASDRRERLNIYYATQTIIIQTIIRACNDYSYNHNRCFSTLVLVYHYSPKPSHKAYSCPCTQYLCFAAKCFLLPGLQPPIHKLTNRSFHFTATKFSYASLPTAQYLIPRAWTTPTLQGNKVSLRLSRQVDAPNQCSSANKAIYVLCSIGTPALPFGCFVALRSLSHSLLLLQPSFGQLLVSFAPLHSLRPPFRYHYTTFVAKLLLHFMASHLQAHKANTWQEAHSISQNQRYNTHWVSLSLHYVLHSFQ